MFCLVQHRELAKVVFAAADLKSRLVSESKRAKAAETLVNLLEGRIRNGDTPQCLQSRFALILQLLLGLQVEHFFAFLPLVEYNTY